MEFNDPQLAPIWNKVQDHQRLDLGDVRQLYASPDVIGVGWMAKQVKERRYGRKAFYVLNQKLEPTNVCVLACKFCDFATKRGRANAYEMSVEEMIARCQGDIQEIHISGGMPPEWTFDTYIELVRRLRAAFPTVAIKAFTAVEIEWAARISKQSLDIALARLKEAGLTALPGGGAEVFSERVRKALFPFKIGAKTWLEVHRTAHRLGIPSNATLLYGHIETPEERWRHLEMLRALQDESLANGPTLTRAAPFRRASPLPPGEGEGGVKADRPPTEGEGSAAFMSFIPLAFQPGATGLAVRPPTMMDDLKMLAISRLYLDNFPHIKAYWVTLTPDLAQVALRFGADDLDGTIVEERIIHGAGTPTERGMTRVEIEKLIRDAGRDPVERDTLYNSVQRISELV